MNLLFSILIACGGGADEAASADAPAADAPAAEAPAAEAPAAEAPATKCTESPAVEGVLYEGEAWAAAGDGIPTIDESGATTTETGLKIIHIAEGTGASPVAGKPVSVHYHGWLESNCSQFDSSARRNSPLTFPVGVGMVIPGWDEGLLALKEGGKARLRIPGNLAYGPRSPTPKIPPNSALVFDVWLVSVGG